MWSIGIVVAVLGFDLVAPMSRRFRSHVVAVTAIAIVVAIPITMDSAKSMPVSFQSPPVFVAFYGTARQSRKEEKQEVRFTLMVHRTMRYSKRHLPLEARRLPCS